MSKNSLKQILVTLALVCVLISTLLTGLASQEAMQRVSPARHNASQLAWFCPPPPVIC